MKSRPSASWRNNCWLIRIRWRAPTWNWNARALSPSATARARMCRKNRAPLPQREKIKILASRADALLTEARHLDVGLAEVIKLLRERDALMETEDLQK